MKKFLKNILSGYIAYKPEVYDNVPFEENLSPATNLETVKPDSRGIQIVNLLENATRRAKAFVDSLPDNNQKDLK